jgi:hypothetical protein
MPETDKAPWEMPGWLEGVWQWVDWALERAGLAPADAIERHQERPWAVVLKVVAGESRLVFKAAAPGLKHEVPLHRAIYLRHPEGVPSLVGVDPERGWLLMRDDGRSLRSAITSAQDVGQFERALGSFARLQLDWLNKAEELLRLGGLDRRLDTLPAAFAGLIEDPGLAVSGRAEGLSSSERRRLIAQVPEVRSACQRLAAWGPPATLHHDDFHDANVYVCEGERGLRFADWGEAGAAHPIFSPMIALRSLARRLRPVPDSPVLERLCDAYLGMWESFGPPEQIRQAFGLAERLAPISRALTWHAVMSALPADRRGQDGSAAAS